MAGWQPSLSPGHLATQLGSQRQGSFLASSSWRSCPPLKVHSLKSPLSCWPGWTVPRAPDPPLCPPRCQLGEEVAEASFSLQLLAPKSLSAVQSLSHVQLFVSPWTTVLQASLSIINSWSLLKLMSIESEMPSNHLILYCPLLLLPSIFPSIRVFSNESVLRVRWPKYWSFSFSISTSDEYSGLFSFQID